MSLAEIKTNGFRWINIIDADRGEIDFLRHNFPFHPLDLEDTLISGQRPRIEKHEDHFFLVLIFPVYNRQTREIEPSEIDFFVSKDYLVTLHDSKLPPINEICLACQNKEAEKEKLMKNGPAFLLYQILNKLLCYCYPMLDHISLDIRTIEKQIFAGFERKMLSELLITRRNITDYRKIMQAHKNTLKKLANLLRENKAIIQPRLLVYFNDLIELSKEIWDHLESFKEAIEALQQTNESLISNRLNDIMKTFTTMSVIIFAMTLVATIFGIGAGGTPFLALKWSFWLIILILAMIAGLMWQFFKKKKYL